LVFSSFRVCVVLLVISSFRLCGIDLISDTEWEVDHSWSLTVICKLEGSHF
jgi:hypothetical protein